MSTTKSKSSKTTTAKKAAAKSSKASKASLPKAAATRKAASASKTPTARKPPAKAATAKKTTAAKPATARKAAPAGKTATKTTARKAAAAAKPAAGKKTAPTKAPAKAASPKTGKAAKAPVKAAAAKTAAPKKKTSAKAAKPQAAPAASARSSRKPALTAPREETKPAIAKARLPAQNGVETSMPLKKPTTRSEFKPGEFIVYPAHGVGKIVGVDTQEVAGIKLDLFVISFIKDKMTLRVPVPKATAVGMRKLADAATVKRALETVRGRARIKRTMWSRRAQEYEAKINSGDLIAISEVVRDLFRADSQPEQSYSERQLYEAALDRMAREIAAINKTDEQEAITLIEAQLAKAPKRPVKGAEEEEEAEEVQEQEKAA